MTEHDAGGRVERAAGGILVGIAWQEPWLLAHHSGTFDLVDKARNREGVRPGSPEQLALPDAVRREPAWLPIALITGAVVVLGVSFFL